MGLVNTMVQNKNLNLQQSNHHYLSHSVQKSEMMQQSNKEPLHERHRALDTLTRYEGSSIICPYTLKMSHPQICIMHQK